MDQPLLIIIISLILSAFFSGMEIAFLTANKLRIELDKKQGLFASRIISVFVQHPSKYIITMLVGNNIALVIYGLMMAAVLESFLEMYFNNSVLVLTLQTIISTIIILVTAEFLPKAIFRNIPNTSLNILSIPLVIFYIVLYPITFFITSLADLIIKLIKGDKDSKNKSSQKIFNKIDLLSFITQVQENEMIDKFEEKDFKLFQNALEFSSVKVRDCMVPRTEIAAIEINGGINELRQLFIETGFSKILVFKESIDDIVGYITLKSLFKNRKSFKSGVIPISYVPETMQANRLLKKFIQEKKSMAVVVDEFGGVSGMLTIEDIIEEIFGEIEDEHDHTELIEKQIKENEFILSARLEIDYLNEKFSLKIPVSEDYDTLAGLIIYHYENIPKINERIKIEPFEIKILKASNTRIELVHLKRISH